VPDSESQRHWFWATLVLSSISIVSVVFAFWELVENRYFSDIDYVSLHYLYVSRGIASSLLLAIWAAWFVVRQRHASETELRRSRERYRGLLDASPAAIALYDDTMRVLEWNVSSERLYGFRKSEVIGERLPTIPPEREAELADHLQLVQRGESVLDQETLRVSRGGEQISVRLSLLPYLEAGSEYFLEATSDIREQVRFRQTMLEIEKLASMGLMAAGTAHHLNTPLASMLLRTQMMRQRNGDGEYDADLARLEASIGFCQQFVHRLLEFSRRPSTKKQPEELQAAIESAMSFVAPSFLAKNATLQLRTKPGTNDRILADRNEIETLFLILLSNALDAVNSNGMILVECDCPPGANVYVTVSDNGCGINPAYLPHVFEPFFTTKTPGRGTGLGLSIARNIVTEHGGSIKLLSEVGQGTQAIIQLPLCESNSSLCKVIQ
jgi:two-component system, NtrC family, sensor kinase